ncbi:15-cis-phytoene desaturase [Acrasis kona]|uniref:15-cis-phytoene desaturase n=1 Tax=Acrasis kona TaxID=1008807 RepID=A0AAW2ZH68_9EUKA
MTPLFLLSILICVSSIVCADHKTVAVLGGGVGGLSAALELAQRGYQVEVYDRQEVFGGKARSIPVFGSGKQGRTDLYGEHGFRFFPGFYAHMDDMFSRVPFGTNKSVLDNLVHADFDMLARDGKDPWVFPTHRPHSTSELLQDLKEIVHFKTLNVSMSEFLYFAERITVMATTCERRWDTEYDQLSYWDFMNADKLSEQYAKYLVIGLTRNIVAAKAQSASLKTIGRTFIRLLQSTASNHLDRLLNGPTNEKWLSPMVKHLKEKYNVKFHPLHTVMSFDYNKKDNQIQCVNVLNEKNQLIKVTADHYVSGVPVERMSKLVTEEIAQAAPSLSQLKDLRVDWMNGIQFFTKSNIGFNRGHVGYFDSPWALTSISQQQFWDDIKVSETGDGTAIDILSVDISDWNVPGYKEGPSGGKTASKCSKQEIIDEVWYQLHRHLPNIFPKDMNSIVTSVFMDPDIKFNKDGRSVDSNDEPLLINTVGSWNKRPQAITEINNLFLASDYVQTKTDVACMEAATEAARAAANGVLKRDGREQDVKMFDLIWPSGMSLKASRWVDCKRFDSGKKHIGWSFPIPGNNVKEEQIRYAIEKLAENMDIEMNNQAV